jgi:hypothetical protein
VVSSENARDCDPRQAAVIVAAGSPHGGAPRRAEAVPGRVNDRKRLREHSCGGEQERYDKQSMESECHQTTLR